MLSSKAEGLRVLVVEDDHFMRKTLTDILEMQGYRPRGAPNGRDGLRTAQQMPEPPAIAVVDLRLPDMDGIELVAKLHAISRLTEVVILTGNASLETAVQALREESFDYLTKPVEPELLLATLDRAGERWRRKLAETALGESERRLRRMFQAIADAVLITDAAGRIVDANPAAQDLSGYDATDLRLLALPDLLHPTERADAPDARPQAGPAAPDLAEYVLTTRQGYERITEVRTAEFAPDRYVHSARDLTERRRLERQLQRAQRMDAVGQFAGGLAHDFNNTLTAIRGYAQLLLEELSGIPAAEDDLAQIVEATERAAGLTRQLLAFSRRQVLTPRVLDLNTVVRELEKMLRRLLREDIDLVTDLGTSLGTVRADATQLEQVLVNLVVNARDAMPDGGRLTILTRNTDLDEGRARSYPYRVVPGPYVALVVRDTGIGMDADTLSHVFEPFFTTKEVGKGTGLGLATTYGIVKQSGGYIWVESEPGRGTEFTIYLPRLTDEPEPFKALEATRAGQGRGTETVLLAEDDGTVRAFVRRAMEGRGYHILEAGDAEAALELARRHEGPIHLLLTDLVMPGRSGRELARLVSTLHPEARVLFMSGHREEGTSEPATPFLPKPFGTETLLARVRELLDEPPRAG